MGQANGKAQKIDCSNPPKLKHFHTDALKNGVTKMSDLRKVLDTGYDLNIQTEVGVGYSTFSWFEISSLPVDYLQKTKSGVLHLAAVSEYVGVIASMALVRELIDRKADLDIKDAKGFTPLHLACGLRETNVNNLNLQVNQLHQLPS